MKQFFTILLIIVPAAYFGYEGKEAVMGLAILAGAIAGGFLNIDKFENFSGAGFSAEMKKEVKMAVDEVYVTIDNLKDLAKPIFHMGISNLTNDGRFKSMGLEEKEEYKDSIVALAKNLDVYDEEFQKKITGLNRMNTYDLYSYFVRQIEKDIGNTELINDLYNLRDVNLDMFPEKEQIQNLLTDIQLSENASQKLDEYLYYKKHNKILAS
ncbi:hypothetical protein M1D47_12605 [Bacillus sp. R1-10]